VPDRATGHAAELALPRSDGVQDYAARPRLATAENGGRSKPRYRAPRNSELQPIEPKPTDLREVCRNVVEEFEATIQLDVEGDVTGTWDQDRLAEVLSNLLGNAIEYAAPGTVLIVKAHTDGAEVVVEISNQGDPIPADLLPFLFEPFRRARQREKSETGNLGLGLYIARQIMLSHGGTLDAHSAGGMTTFVMRLPRRPLPHEERRKLPPWTAAAY
jgi:signal transduction histidine kinase